MTDCIFALPNNNHLEKQFTMEKKLLRNKRLSLLIVGFAIVTSTFSFTSCGRKPFVSKSQTVESYNSSIRVASEIVHENLGYERRYEDHYASTYYKYVLTDGNVRCPVTKSASPVFKTESDNPNGPIHVNDICIDCGHTWKEHKRW